MILSEYDRERHMRQVYEEGRAEGERLGRAEGERLGREKVFKKALQLLQPLLANGQMEDLEKAVNDPEFQKKLLEEFDIL